MRISDRGDRPSYILGVNGGPHDGSAALLRDGTLVAMLEQERLNRQRYAFRCSPSGAIAACLAEEGIGLDAVSEIAVGWDVPVLMDVDGRTFDERQFIDWMLGPLTASARQLPRVRYVDHHLAHAASAFYASGLARAAILVVDGRGETAATTLAVGRPDGIEVVRSWGTHLSLGHFYGWAAEWAGLTMWDAGKFMGLAAYGNATQHTPLSVAHDGYAFVDGPPAGTAPGHFLQLRSHLRDSFRHRNHPDGPGRPADVMAYADFAASMQKALEGALLALARMARAETGEASLVMAGGVALNCTANGLLIRSNIFDEVWIPPFAYDAGVSAGAAYVADRASNGPRPPSAPLTHAFLAPATEIHDGDIASQLSECDVDSYQDGQLHEVVARHLADGRLVGWWQGRGEVGQRALGARSILCDPRRREHLVRANIVKGREVWRPLAPAVLAEHAGELFADRLNATSDFMLSAWPVREDMRARLSAAVHVDGSARPQIVRQGQPRYHGVIRAFHERTGVPAVINTSFNLAGEPIVHSADDAISTFLRSELDVLVLDNVVAVKRNRDGKPPSPPRRQVEDQQVSPWT